MSIATITCPTGCEGDLPIVLFDVCAPDVDFGNIEKIYLTNIGNPLANVEDAAEWLTRLSNSSTDADAIRYLHVIGELPEPEQEETEISLCRTIYSDCKYQLPFEIDETNLTNHEFMRKTHCNTDYLMWFASGKYIYGGNDGIQASLRLNMTIPRECRGLKKYMGLFTWENEFPPVANENPLL